MVHRFSMKKRFLCFIVGLALSGIGVAFSTAPELGTSPISGPCYVMTFVVPFSFGVWTIIFNALFIVGQMLILRKDFKYIQLTQILAVSVFGFFIDVGMALAQLYELHAYWARFAEQVAGCVILAVGIGCQLAADLIYNPGEALVKAIVTKYKKNFGTVKIWFDSSMVVLAVIISVLATGEVKGVREGTVVAAFLVGATIKMLRKPMRGVKMSLLQAA